MGVRTDGQMWLADFLKMNPCLSQAGIVSQLKSEIMQKRAVFYVYFIF